MVGAFDFSWSSDGCGETGCGAGAAEPVSMGVVESGQDIIWFTYTAWTPEIEMEMFQRTKTRSMGGGCI